MEPPKPSALASFAAKQQSNHLVGIDSKIGPQGKPLAKLQVSSLEALGDPNSSTPIDSLEVLGYTSKSPKVLSALPTTDGRKPSLVLNPISTEPTTVVADQVTGDPDRKEIRREAEVPPSPRTAQAQTQSKQQHLQPLAATDSSDQEKKADPGASTNTLADSTKQVPVETIDQIDSSNSARPVDEKVIQENNKGSGDGDNRADNDGDQDDFNFDDIDTSDQTSIEHVKESLLTTEAKFSDVDVDDLYDCPNPSDEISHSHREREQARRGIFVPRTSDIELFHVVLTHDVRRVEQFLDQISPEEMLEIVDSAGRTIYHYAALSKVTLVQELIFEHVNSYREAQFETEIEKLMRKREQINAWTEGSRVNGKGWVPPRVKELQRELTKQKCADWAKIISNVDENYRSIFHYIATTSSTIPVQDDYEFCSVLRTRPDVLSARDSLNKMAFHYAVEAGNIRQVKWYFQMGLRLNQEDVDQLLSCNATRVMEDVILRHLEAIDMHRFYHSTLEDRQNEPGISAFAVAKLQRRVDVSTGRLHQSPLHRAAMYGNIKAVDLLLEQGADPTARDANHWTPLHYCAEEATVNHLSIAKLLMSTSKAIDVNAGSLKGRSPLHIAARAIKYSMSDRDYADRVSFVEYLHTCKADLDLKDMKGATPLLLACRGGHVDIAKFLLQIGCDPTATEKHGWNCLHFAASRGIPTMISFLLSWDADSQLWLNSADFQGRKPVDVARNEKMLSNLWAACYNGNVEQVKRLLVSQPKGMCTSVSVKDRTIQTQRTPLHLAVLGYMNAMKMPEASKTSSSSLEKVPKRDKMTELNQTAPSRFLQIAVLLLQAGAELCTQDKWGITPLMLAACMKDAIFNDALLERISSEKEFFIADSGGNTALHYSYAFCQAKISTMLEDHMGDTDLENNQGKSPFEMTGYRDKIFPKEYREFIKRQQALRKCQ